MAGRLQRFLGLMGHYKYLIVFAIGIAVVGFLDENSFVQRMKYGMQISDLKEEIKRYNVQHEADAKRLRELKSDPKAIEKIARERYFMKADDEDIFVLSDEKLQPSDNDTTR